MSLIPRDDASFLLSNSKVGSQNVDFIFGIDEVGVACLAGPVVACCFCYPREEFFKIEKPSCKIFDSKTLSAKQKAESEKWLKDCSGSFYAYGEASPGEIDSLNIYHATNLAMIRAFEAVVNLVTENLKIKNTDLRAKVLIDGNRIPKEWPKVFPQVEPDCIVKGDTKSFAVASASILAKTHRDRKMKALHSELPVYGWDTNVGYPTPSHKKALHEFGSTSHHRKSFRY